MMKNYANRALLVAFVAIGPITSNAYAQACVDVNSTPVDVSELAACVVELGLEVERLKIQDKGMIAAFPNACPTAAGWKPYKEAAGRMILGVGAGKAPGSTGGAETHTLIEAEMPLHNHNNGPFTSLLTTDGKHTVIQTDSGAHNDEPNIGRGGNGEIVSAGDGQPHNNMPPYIALYFCKKGG